MLLISSPLCKPCEAPAALAYLAASLRGHGRPCTICDMNREAVLFLVKMAQPASDTWSRRAFKNLERNIAAIKSYHTYKNIDRYRRAVADVNRVVEIGGRQAGLQLSLANYQDETLSPLSSAALRQAARNFRENIFYPYFSKRLEELLTADHSSTVGFSLNFLSQAICTFAMIGYLRQHHPERTIIIGGGLVTSWLSNPGWQNHFTDLVDHFITGPGEEPLLRLLGVTSQSTHFTPDYTDLVSTDYLSPGFILPYTSSFGCFWKKCSFCPEKSEKNPYSHLPAQTTIADLKYLVGKTSPTLIHMLDNAISPATLKSLAADPPGAPWYGFVRFDNLLSQRDFCFALRQSGCVMLKLGLESGDQQVLDRMNKGIDLQMASRILHNLREAGIATYIYLLFGTPAETPEAAERTLHFAEEHHLEIGFLNLAIFNLPTCSPETSELDTSDFYEGDLSMYRNFNHPYGWNRGEIRRFLDSRFKRSRKIATIIAADPPIFTSNHAPFFCQQLPFDTP